MSGRSSRALPAHRSIRPVLVLAVLLLLIGGSCSDESEAPPTRRSVEVEVRNGTEVELTDVEVSVAGETARRDRLAAGEEPGLLLRLPDPGLDHPAPVAVTWRAQEVPQRFSTTVPLGEVVKIVIETPDGSQVRVSTTLCRLD